MKFDSNIISERVTAYRNREGIKPPELATRCGLTPGYINNLERGIGITPTVDNLQKIAEALNTTIDNLLADNLKVFYGLEIANELDKEILKRFYMLSTDKKFCVLEIIGAFNKYQVGVNENQELLDKTIPLDIRDKITSSAYLQEILLETSDLSDAGQKTILDIIRPTIENLIKMEQSKDE